MCRIHELTIRPEYYLLKIKRDFVDVNWPNMVYLWLKGYSSPQSGQVVVLVFPSTVFVRSARFEDADSCRLSPQPQCCPDSQK